MRRAAKLLLTASLAGAGAFPFIPSEGTAQVSAQRSDGASNVSVRQPALALSDDPLTQAVELSASNGRAFDEFGYSTAVSDNTIVVGAPHHTGGGAVYVFTKGTSGWTQSAVLAPPEPSRVVGNFGYSVAMYGDTIAAGTPDVTPSPGEAAGAVYLYTMPSSGWSGTVTSSATLTASGTQYDHVGYSVAISEGEIIAGAPFVLPNLYHVTVGPTEGRELGESKSAAYVYTMPASGWSGTLSPSAALTVAGHESSEEFGIVTGLSGATAAVDAFGKERSREQAYVYTMPAGGWSGTIAQRATLEVAKGTAPYKPPLAVADNVIAVGRDVYVRPASGWSGTMAQSAELTVSGSRPEAQDFAGVAISGDTILAENEEGAEPRIHDGAVYVFTEPGSGWSGEPAQSAVLASPDDQHDDGIRGGLAVFGGTLVVGATTDQTERGAAYVFTEGASGWESTIAPPLLTHARQSATRWRLGRRLPRIAAAGGLGHVGTRFFFTLDEPGEAELVFRRVLGGRVVGGRCVATNRRNARREHCQRTSLVDQLSFFARSGGNTVSFEGPISRAAADSLVPGRYTVTIRAYNRAAQAATPARLSFTTVK